MGQRSEVNESESIDAPSGDAKLSMSADASEPSIEAAGELAKAGPASFGPKSEPPRPDFTPSRSERPPAMPANRSLTVFAPPTNSETGRRGKFAMLAASVALAAGLGALIGAVGATGLARQAAPEAAGSDQIGALQNEIAQMRTELSAIRTSVETATRTSSTQFAKFSERMERVEKTQAEPAAKLAKAVEALERFERRVEPAKETTGSVPRPPQSVPAPPVVQDWVLRDVYNGVALIKGGRMGTIEVEAGDTVPGLGRIEAIRKQEGRWVVVTSKGLITASR